MTNIEKYEKKSKIKGLTINYEFITQEYENKLIENIKNSDWNYSSKRRTQYYGYMYDYTTTKFSEKNYLGPFPKWLDDLAEYVKKNKNLDKKFDQAIVNEYLPGQGILPHIDSPLIFGSYICNISLGNPIMMIFSTYADKEEIYLEPRTLLEIDQEARYRWYHHIPARKYDFINDSMIERDIRYSITFRNTI